MAKPPARIIAILAPAILLAMLAAPQTAAACSCWHPTVEEHMQSAQVIFTGTVTEIKDADRGRTAIFDVETNWKGTPGARAEVSFAESDGANCGWSFKEGQRTTVFAGGSGNRLVTGMCMMIPYTRPAMRSDYDFGLQSYRSKWQGLAAQAAARPGDKMAQLVLASFLEEANDLDGASRAYAAAIAAAPDEWRGHAGLGRILFAMTQYSAAVEPLTRAAALQPHDPEVNRLLGQARVKAGTLTDLTKLDFHGFKMNNVDLSNAEMRGRDFSESRLGGSNFSGATLTGARFIDADLNHVNFTNADLRAAQLDRLKTYKADLTGADLTHARLADANFFHGILKDANLTGVNGQKAKFESATTAGARFDGADLQSASFRVAHAADTDFADANLVGADFRGADLRGANLSRARIGGANFEGAHYDCRTRLPEGFDPNPHPMIAVEPICDGRPMNRDFSGMKLETTDFAGLDLRGANFQNTAFGPSVKFWDADLRGADFSDSRGADDFRGTDLTGADFTNAQDVGSFYGVLGRPAILNGVKFAGVRLSPRSFLVNHKDMTSADITQADLKGAIFSCRSWEKNIGLLREIKSKTSGIIIEGDCLN